MIFENPFTLPAYKIFYDKELKLNYLKTNNNLGLLDRYVLANDEDVDDENSYIPLLTLPINHKLIKTLVNGDVFFNAEEHSFYVFTVITVKKAINSFVFLKFNQKNIKYFIEKTYHFNKKNFYYDYNNDNMYEIFLNEIIKEYHKNNSIIKIQDMNFEKLYFLSNMYYHDEFDNHVNVLTKEDDFNAEYHLFFKRLIFTLSYTNEFRLIETEIDYPKMIYNDNILGSKHKYIYDIVDQWRPLIHFSLKCNDVYKDTLFYLHDIYEIKDLKDDNSIGFIFFDTTDYIFKIKNKNNKIIHRFVDMFNINSFDSENGVKVIHSLDEYDEIYNDYEDKILYFI